jgi:hypothetical protein
MAVQPRDATPQRPRAHVIADLSVNHVERFFIAAGHVPTGVPKDYGYDITVVTHDRRGNAENRIVYLQLKASERLTFAPGTRSYPFQISRRHYNLWKNEIMPVFLVRYSARTARAYWLYLQPFFERHPNLFKRPSQKTAMILIPSARRFDAAAVEYMADRKREAAREALKVVKHKA